MAERATPELIAVASFSEPYLAHLCRTFLAENDVESFVAHEHIVTANWLEGIAHGGVRLMVRARDAPRAVSLVREHEALLRDDAAPIDWSQVEPSWADDALPTSPTPHPYACPACGCTEAYYEALSRRKIMLSVLLLGVPLPFWSRAWRCDRCGHRWKNRLF